MYIHMLDADAIATALAPMVKELHDANESLTAIKEREQALKSSIAPTLARLNSVEAQLRDALADKFALEQQMLLGNAQKLARQRAWRVSGVPKMIGLFIFLCTMPLFFPTMFIHSLQSYFIDVFIAAGLGMTCMFLSLRPTDTFGVRCMAALVPTMIIQNVVILGVPLGFLLSSYVQFPDGERLRHLHRREAASVEMRRGRETPRRGGRAPAGRRPT